MSPGRDYSIAKSRLPRWETRRQETFETSELSGLENISFFIISASNAERTRLIKLSLIISALFFLFTYRNFLFISRAESLNIASVTPYDKCSEKQTAQGRERGNTSAKKV